MRKAKFRACGLVLGLAIAGMPARAQMVSAASVQRSQTALNFPPGNSIYIYGMATGGLYSAVPFFQGSTQELKNAAGELVGDISVTTSNSNIFATRAAYYTIGGVAISGISKVEESYGLNTDEGASSASDTFTVARDSLVVVVAMAGGQATLIVAGIPGLQIDAQAGNPTGGTIPLLIGHVNLSPGTYTVTENSFPSLAPGKDPKHMADLIGVFVFSGPAPSVWLFPACVNGQQVVFNGAPVKGISPTAGLGISWDWGDGSSTTKFFPAAHSYSTPGQYAVKVTANWKDGETASRTQEVSVGTGILSNCFAMKIAASEGGSVSYEMDAGSGTVAAGNSVTLQTAPGAGGYVTANPAPGYSFSKWEPLEGLNGINGVALSATSPSIIIIPNTSASITAVFTRNSD